jgi:glutathione synthase/RimK-type ligase-like ATP-grasp enzyme
MKRVAFTTCAAIPLLDEDDHLAIAPLRERGVEVVPWIWDAPEAPRDLDAVVHRSCWDYHTKPAAFLSWLDALAASGLPSWNPAPLLRWNVDKRYLRDLAARGARIPETVWIEKGERVDLAALLRAHELDEVVIKPQISLSAFGTFRASRASAAAAQPQLDALVAERGMMVQAFLPAIVDRGELSLVFLGGQHSHTVRKTPRAGDFRVQNDHGGTRKLEEPTPSLIAAAAQVIEAAAAPLLYARVDFVETSEGLVLMELEAIDPALFLAFSPGAPERFADSIARALGGAPESP